MLAEWCAADRLVFGDTARARALVAVLDTVGCMLAGARDPAVVAASTLVPEMPSGTASSVAHAHGVSAAWAALVNGCAAHALDFDDNFFPAITHASAVLVPALFALAEECSAAPTVILDAYIVGLEVQAHIGKLVNPSHYESGWHATSTIGTIGAAAACARLLGLNADAVQNAISMGFSFAGGSKRQFGTMVKPLHAGMAAMHGVMAARLAAAGMSAYGDVLQGRWSFEELFNGYGDYGMSVPELFPDAPLAIDEYGLVAKLYPSCMSTHLAIDGLLALHKRTSINPAAIKAIDIYMPPFMIENLRYVEPRNEMEARFSMNYCAALAIAEGLPRLSHFTHDAIFAAGPRQLLPLVRMHIREPSLEAAKLPWGGDALVKVTLRSGVVLESVSAYPKGCSQNPLSTIEQRMKFLDCTSSALDEGKAETLYRLLRDFSKLKDIRQITCYLRPSH
jgi:2-methylcitrate dehydratase PrpD